MYRAHEACMVSQNRHASVPVCWRIHRKVDGVALRQRDAMRQGCPQVARRTSACRTSPIARSSTLGKHSTGPGATRSAVAVLPGFLSAGAQYKSLCGHLLDLGHPAAEALNISRSQWWPTLGGASFSWYLEEVSNLVQRLHQQHGAVALVGVSAGGWLGRLALGGEPYAGRTYKLVPLVSTLITLGTPHQSLEAYPFGRAQEKWLLDTQVSAPAGNQPADTPSTTSIPGPTHGRPETSLQYANACYPDANAMLPTKVVCVVGDAYEGTSLTWQECLSSAQATNTSPLALALDTWFAASSYTANCGRVQGVKGDGVCPLETGALPGAQLVVLPGVWHNPKPGHTWYGDAAAVAQWDVWLP